MRTQEGNPNIGNPHMGMERYEGEEPVTARQLKRGVPFEANAADLLLWAGAGNLAGTNALRCSLMHGHTL